MFNLFKKLLLIFNIKNNRTNSPNNKLLEKANRDIHHGDKSVYNNQIQNLTINNIVQEKNAEYFKLASDAYKKKGTPKYFIDTCDLSQKEKAALYDKVIYDAKGKYPKNNPYNV